MAFEELQHLYAYLNPEERVAAREAQREVEDLRRAVAHLRDRVASERELKEVMLGRLKRVLDHVGEKHGADARADALRICYEEKS